MAYSAEISRRNPTCFLFLIDQSGSMSDPFGGATNEAQKARFVADSLNRTLQNLIVACAKSEGIRDYFSVGVIGYSSDAVMPAFGGELKGRALVPISELASNPARVEERRRKESDGAGGIIEVNIKFPIWFDPQAHGGTPMVKALSQAHRVLKTWVAEHPDSFPPVVLHITDGESTDGDPTTIATQLKELATNDGNVLLFNLHVSSNQLDAIRFPQEREVLPPDNFAHLLYNISSTLPPHMVTAVEEAGYPAQEGSRGFVFNADIEDVVTFLQIGTLPANLR